MNSPQTRPARARPAPVPGSTNSPRSSPSLHSSPTQARPYADPSLNELCRLETFQNHFNTNDFVAQLSEKLIQRSKADPGPFNPRPFIRTFESALENLIQIRSQVTAQVSQLSSAVHVAESAYTKKLDELSKNFTAVGTSFSALEERISEVGRTAIRIGEQLETIDRQRNRASEAHDLIEYYYMFARGDTSRLEKVRKEGGKEGRMKAAVIARRLSAISREVDVAGSEQTRDAIDRYCERFERDMLKLFDKFYRKSDPKMMSHIAKVLQGFNGGSSCVQIYVNQHDFFISKDRVGEAERIEVSDIWANLANPDAPPPKSEPALASLFAEIRQTVEIEAQIISAVFPNPLVVMQTFLQRVFAQSVQAFVEVIMEKAAEVPSNGAWVKATAPQPGQAAGSVGLVDTASLSPTSHLAFLRALHMARSNALSLVNDLKMYDFRGVGISASSTSAPSGSHITNGISELGSLSLIGSDGAGAASAAHSGGSPLAVMLDQAVEELFVPYMEGIRYLDRESKSLADLYNGFLARFISYHKTPHKAKASTTIFNRMRNQITASTDPSSTSATSTSSSAVAAAAAATAGAKSSFFKLSGLADRVRGGGTSSAAATAAATASAQANAAEIESSSNDPSVDDHTGMEERDGELSLDTAERMLRWHAEAIGRCVDLSNPSDVPKNTFTLLKTLTQAYIKNYVETALDSALTVVMAQDARGPTLPDLTPMSVIRHVELIIALWQHYVNTALVPLASSSVTIRREMVIFNNHNLLRVEGKCDALLQRIADNVVTYLSTRLSTQKKNDFTPKNDDLAFSRMNTEPCIACSEALERVQMVARNSLSTSSRASNSISKGLTSSPSIGGGGGGSGSGGIVMRPGSSGNGLGGRDESTQVGLSRNAESFLTEIGVAFHGLLLEHLRKFTVSAAGGLMLTKDLAVYQDAISTFGIPAVSDRFEMLRQLGNLFIVQPAVLKSYMREAHLAKVDERLLRPYLLRRSDYSKEVRDLDDLPTTTTTTTHRTMSSINTSVTSHQNETSTSSLVLASSIKDPMSPVGGAGDLLGSNLGLPSGLNGADQELAKSNRLGEILRDLQSWSNLSNPTGRPADEENDPPTGSAG
ncbi:exocyst complex component Sec10 [Violaceomyces palustris]|uniref:Exocyst complex component Sec10 n=1 Tax=Violaceomyces palustris TaxID=1673888 RepID=A0ACD0NT18_9BASI|nr:exocyst complex component Sec10 [Violaceomyces palustris]